MVCVKCNGLMALIDVYTDGNQPTKALQCMNCGTCRDYALPKLRVIPVNEYKMPPVTELQGN